MVDEKIGFQLKKAGRGTIFHDGWSKNGFDYVVVYGCFMKEGVEHKNKNRKLR